MGGQMNQILSEALAEGGRLGAEAAIKRTDQQRQLGVAIAQKLAASGEFNNMPPELQGAYKKMLGETAVGGLSQLSDINSQLAVLRQGAQQQLQAPILQETNVQVPRPPSELDMFAGQQPQGGFSPIDIPPTMTQQQTTQRAPTPSEQFDRVKMDSAAAALVGGTDFGNIVRNQMELRLEESKLHAKTQFQLDMSNKLAKWIEGADNKDKEMGRGVGGLAVRGASVNPATGNFNLNLGVVPIEELRQGSVDTAQQLIQQAMTNQTATANEVLIGMQAKGQWHGTPAQMDQILDNTANQIVATQTNAGVPIGQALEMARKQTGRIPQEFEKYMPEAAEQAYKLERAKQDAGLMTKLSDIYTKAATVDRALMMAEATQKKLIENQLTPLSGKAKETAALELDTMRRLKRLHSNYRAALLRGGRGYIPTKALSVFGLLKDGEAEFRTEISQLQAQYVKSITQSQYGEAEARRLISGVFDQHDTPQMFEAKVLLMLHNMGEMQRVRRAIELNGGKRWGADAVFKTIEINGTPIQVVDEAASSAVIDRSLQLDWNSSYESQAGIAVFANGTVQNVNKPNTAPPNQSEQISEDQQAFRDQWDAAFKKTFGGKK